MENRRMELRLLTSKHERRIFAERVAMVRDQSGVGYREVSNGEIDNKERLAAADLLGLFDAPGAPPERMIAGIAVHDLEVFPQSCREPDLSHFSPRHVFECSDHWSLAAGAGVRVWYGAALHMARMRPLAILAYLAVGPADHTGFYASMGFKPTGIPVPHPYMKTAEGENLMVQAMVIEGERLRRWQAMIDGISAEASGSRIHLEATGKLRPLLRRTEGRGSRRYDDNATVPAGSVVEAVAP
jgi:hypothetical protein